MPKNDGFSLIELMIALLVSSFLFVGFLSVAGAGQRWSSHLVLLLERDANFWLSPLLLARWIMPAGNNREGQTWEGLSLQPEQIAINSDIDGPDGFPDDELSSSFEELVLRSANSNLQVKSGKGSFQPLIKNIADLRAAQPAVAFVSIRLQAAADRPLVPLGEPLSDSTELHFFLRNYRPNLFAEDPQ